MKKLLLAGFAAVLLGNSAFAAPVEYRKGFGTSRDTVPVTEAERLPIDTSRLAPLGYQQLTSLGSAVGLTVPTDATACIAQAETQSVRWRDDGTNPTSSVGSVIAAGSTVAFVGATSLAAVRFIETTSSAKLNVSCYK